LIMIDIHSHILPGLDDGAQSLEESLIMAEIAVKNGIDKMVATPHLYRGDNSHNNIDNINAVRNNFVEALKEKNIALEIYSGAEVHISHNLLTEIKEHKESLVINKGSYIMVEFPSDHIFTGVKQLFFDLMSEELIPIIAHPERNSIFRQSPELLFDLVQMGGLCQVNSGSFKGLYGTRAKEAAIEFIKSNFIHFVGSDCHNTRASKPEISAAVQAITAIIGENKAEALVKKNPKAVLDDNPIPELPEPKNPRDRKKSLKIKLPSFLKR